MTALKFIASFKIFSREKTKGDLGPASNSEVKRWIDSQSVLINGETVEWNEEMNFPLISVVVFPKSEKRVTLL